MGRDGGGYTIPWEELLDSIDAEKSASWSFSRGAAPIAPIEIDTSCSDEDVPLAQHSPRREVKREVCVKEEALALEAEMRALHATARQDEDTYSLRLA